MSEGTADPHGMGAISHTKPEPEGANAKPKTESGTPEAPPLPTEPKQLNPVFGNIKSF